MVHVCMRDEGHVDVAGFGRWKGGSSTEMGDAPRQDGIGDHAVAADVDQGGGMADPGDGNAAHGAHPHLPTQPGWVGIVARINIGLDPTVVHCAVAILLSYQTGMSR